jgi:hypothetical protein
MVPYLVPDKIFFPIWHLLKLSFPIWHYSAFYQLRAWLTTPLFTRPLKPEYRLPISFFMGTNVSAKISALIHNH